MENPEQVWQKFLADHDDPFSAHYKYRYDLYLLVLYEGTEAE